MTTVPSGSKSLAELQSLLPQNIAGRSRWPLLRDASFDATQATLRLWVAADLYWFGGHFPDRPVLAGVVQTHWAAKLGAAIFKPTKVFAGIDALKFHQLVGPDTELSLHLQSKNGGTRIAFVFNTGIDATAGKISEGVLLYS